MKCLRLAIAVLLSSLVWVAGAGGTAAACSCAQITDNEALDGATAVFVGSVQRIDDSREFRDADDVELPDAFTVRYVMEVDGVFKGTALETQVVTTGQRGGGCGVEMTLLGSYLVFARRSGDVITTSLCSGNRAMGATAAEGLLGPARSPEPGIDPGAAQIDEAAVPADALDPTPLGERVNDRNALVYAAVMVALMVGIAVAGTVLGRRARQGGDAGTTMEP